VRECGRAVKAARAAKAERAVKTARAAKAFSAVSVKKFFALKLSTFNSQLLRNLK